MWSDAEKSLLTNHVKSSRHPLVVIVGPTASGKTALALDVAEACNGEIINADSRQLFRKLDIGTAKIRPEEMRGIPHHLIDILDPKESVNIAWFQRHARASINDTRTRGKIPVLVGGSMLYISSVIDGLQPLPSNPELRTRLEKEASTDDGAAAMHARLKDIDPEAAAGIHPNNRVYLIRALELAELGAVKTTAKTEDDLLIFGIRIEREKLRESISKRINQMFDAGWVEEVAALKKDGYSVDDPGMESSGYHEIMAALSSQNVDAVKIDSSLHKAIEDATMRYAKRQQTWWKHDKRIHWTDA